MGRLIGVVASMIVLVGAPAAHACNLPDITVPAKEAGPGEWIDFSISGTDPGAGYKIYAYGEEVLAGADADGGGVTGRFQMPDLGQSSLLAAVELTVTHPNPGSEGADYHGGAPWWGSTRDVHYRAASAPAAKPAAAEPVQPEPKRAQTPAAQRQQSAVREVHPKRRARPPGKRSEGQRVGKRRPASRPKRQRRREPLEEPTLDTTSAPVPIPPAQPRPPASHESGGMRTALLVMSLLTIGGAAYGRVARRRRII